MERFLAVGHRLAFPHRDGWITPHNLARIVLRCLLLGGCLALLSTTVSGSGELAVVSFVVGLAWSGPSAVELWIEREPARQELRSVFTVAFAALLSLGLAFLQLSYAFVSDKSAWTPGVAFRGGFGELTIWTTVVFTVLMTCASYFRVRARVGDPMGDTVGMALGVAGLVYLPLGGSAALSGSALGVFTALIACVQVALGAFVACLPLVILAFWGDWLCARFFRQPS